ARAADQRVDLAGARLLVEVHAVRGKRILLLLLAAFVTLAMRVGGLILIGATRRPGLGSAGTLGNAVADVVHGIVARHLLFLQEVGSVALTLSEDRYKDVRAGHLLTPRRLDMDDRPLD